MVKRPKIRWHILNAEALKKVAFNAAWLEFLE
jgi:hypothetical protein